MKIKRVEHIAIAVQSLAQSYIERFEGHGHGGARIAFLDPSATGNVLIDLAERPAGH
jgi:hypothetical protein